MMKRLLSLTLAVALIIVLAVPVSAADSDGSTWVELLETATVDDSGSNLVTFSSTSQIFRIKTPQYMRCTKVDMLIAHPSGNAPTSVKVRYNNSFYTLTMAKIDAYTTRVYGANLPDALYADLVFQFNKSGTTSIPYQILSCRVTSINASEMPASAYALFDNVQYTTPCVYDYAGDGSDIDSASNRFQHYQFPVMVSDWQKYDTITISGSLDAMALNSVRCMIGGLGLPYEISYTVSNPSGSIGDFYSWDEMKYYSYDDSYKGTSDADIFLYDEYLGKTLFTITIDLSGVDRTSNELLKCYFTCLANPCLGYMVQILGVTGSVRVADVSSVSWWSKIQTFLATSFNSLTSSINTGFSNLSTWISNQTSSITSLFDKYFGVQDQETIDDLSNNSDLISQDISDIQEFEASQVDILNNGFTNIQGKVSFSSFVTALAFVQNYANLTFLAISDYTIIFTLPLFLGLFFFICSRIPGTTHWKSIFPDSKGGDNP